MTYVPTAGSLFSGVGMMDYAFAQAGFDIRFQVEIDDYCQKVMRKHGPTYWPDAKVHTDV
jgi:DNA (cytosine-5)-methyltransferase 1